MAPLIDRLKIPFFTVFFIFAFLYSFSFLFGPLPLAIKTSVSESTDLFTVSGEGEAAATADTARVSLGVTKTAATAELAKNEMNNIANKLISDLKNLGIKETDIKTSNFSVNPNYDYAKGTQTITGYTASQNLDVKTQTVDLANKAIDTATQDGANNIGGVSFTLDDQDKAALEERARNIAIKDAKEKAGSIARAAGIRLGKIVNIQVNSPSQPPIFLESKTADSSQVGEPTRIQPGENTVTVSVTLSYETI